MVERGAFKEKQLTSSYKHGYIVKNMDMLSKRYTCEFCTFILREPTQLTECGHRLCKACIELQGDPIICPNSECQIETLKNQVMLDRAFKRELDSLSVECPRCPWKDILKNYQSHLDEQHPKVICDQCKAEFDSTYSLKKHKLNQCPKSILANNLVRDSDWLNTFIQQSIDKHINDNYRNILVHSIHSDSPEPPRKKIRNDAAVPRINDYNDEATNQTVQISSNETSTTNHEPKCHSNEIIHLQNFKESCVQEVQTMKANIQQLNDLYTELKHKQQDIQQQLTLVNQNPDQREFTTYNGILLWKMINVQTKMNAQSQATPWIDSDSFYTSSAGYKVRLRVYLNGADDALGTHVSIYFILMRGDYDAGLNFPFNYKVSICLFDQTPQQCHVIKSIRPKGSTSFQRPQSEMNIPHKMLKFCSLETLLQAGSPYIQDDSILIKVMVNTGDIMKPILPYAFSLESGLSVDVQRAMIRKKQEKRDQLRLARATATSQNDLELSQATQNLTRPSIGPRQRRQSSSSTSGSRGMSPLDQQDDGALDS